MFLLIYLFFLLSFCLVCFFDVSTITRQKNKRDKDNTDIFYFFVSTCREEPSLLYSSSWSLGMIYIKDGRGEVGLKLAVGVDVLREETVVARQLPEEVQCGTCLVGPWSACLAIVGKVLAVVQQHVVLFVSPAQQLVSSFEYHLGGITLFPVSCACGCSALPKSNPISNSPQSTYNSRLLQFEEQLTI